MAKGAATTKYSDAVLKIFAAQDILDSYYFDLSHKDIYIDGVIILTNDRIGVFENDALKTVIKLDYVKKVCCAEYCGSGLIEVFTSSGRQCLVRFSMRHTEEMYLAVQAINSLIQGESIRRREYLKEEDKICPKCLGPYIWGTHICRRCSDKLGVIKKLWGLSKPCRPIYALLLIYFWIGSIAAILMPVLNKHMVNDVLTNSYANGKTLGIILISMLVLSAVTMGVNILRDAASAKASNLLVLNLRNEIYAKLQRMPLGYIEEKKTGDLIHRINNDTQRIQSFIQDIAIMAVNELFMLIAIAFITFSIDAVMAALVFVTMPIAFAMILKIRLTIQRRYRKQWRIMDKLTSRLTDVLNGIKVVKVFGRENDEIRRFESTAGEVRDLTCRNEKFVYTIFPLIKFIMNLGSFMVLLYGGSRVIGGKLSVGELVQFSSYGSYLYGKIEWFSMLPRHFTMAMASSQRVFEVLDEKEEITNASAIKSEHIAGDFVFNNMSFGYKSYRRVLKNINEHIKSGEMVGLVGHSGAGKSTMINLVMKLYKADSGEILLDSKNLDDYDGASYKSVIGVVLQENYLFAGSILDNIRYAAPNASIKECIIAAKKANAHDFIINLPDGYNTYVGEKGYRLSGGERQRIAIARAIAANPKIIILDEATSALDTETEMDIQEALKNVTKGKTVFAIAHRLSTLKNANRLIVLQDGEIAETGTHDELMKKGGIYASLLRAQQEMAESKIIIDNINQKNLSQEIISEESEEM